MLEKSNSQRSFSWRLATPFFIFLEFLVLLQAAFAYLDGFLTAAQMTAQGIQQGLPFVWHFGMWGDFLIVSALASYVIGCCSAQWHLRWIMLSVFLGLTSAVLFSWLYTLSDMPEAHVRHHLLTPAGAVHVVYMAISIAIFIQLFVFTVDAPLKLLRIAAVLLTLHVFAGNHMLLGIINAIHPLSWYPAQPLKSKIGWITVGAVAASLTWRSFGVVDLVIFFLEGVLDRARSAAGYLRFLNVGAGFVGFGWFATVVRMRLQASEAFRSGDYGSLLFSEDGLALVLILIFAMKYSLSRQSAKRELEIGKTLFPPGRLPDDWVIKDRIKVTGQVVLFLGSYMVLAYVADDILWSSAIMFVIGGFDLRTRHLINTKMKQYFADPQYAPQTNEPEFAQIGQRRKVAEWYLFELPHLQKETACMLGCGVAAVSALLGSLSHSNWIVASAYVVLILTLLLNEIRTVSWRYERERRLRSVGRPELAIRSAVPG